MSVKKRVVIVTGGAYGIGRAIVERFASSGDQVVVADIAAARGETLAREVENCVFRQADMRAENEIASLIDFAVDRFGALDVLCANAGIERNALAADYSTDDWSAMIDVNLRAGFLGAKFALPHLRARGGSIVFTASVQGFATEKNVSIYAASKAGLLGLMRGIALDYAAEGVRVNAVCPGATMTGMLEAAVAQEPDPRAALEALAQKIPMRRLGQPADIANAVYFLASPEASYITGTYLIVDGGLLARHAL